MKILHWHQKVVRITIVTSTNLSTNIETKVLSRQMTHVKNCSFAQIIHSLQHKTMKVDPLNSEKVNALAKNFGRGSSISPGGDCQPG